MERQIYQIHFSIDQSRLTISRLTNRLVYLSGAAILTYVFWLTFTA